MICQSKRQASCLKIKHRQRYKQRMASEKPSPSSPPPGAPQNGANSRFATYMSRMGAAGRGIRRGVNVLVIGTILFYSWGQYVKRVKYLTIRDNTTVTWRLEELGVSETTLDSGDVVSTLSSGTVPRLSLLDALKTLRWMRDDDRITGACRVGLAWLNRMKASNRQMFKDRRLEHSSMTL